MVYAEGTTMTKEIKEIVRLALALAFGDKGRYGRYILGPSPDDKCSEQ